MPFAASPALWKVCSPTLNSPVSSIVSEGVVTPFSSAASAVMTLKIEPVG